jgi:hypothetical protein
LSDESDDNMFADFLLTCCSADESGCGGNLKISEYRHISVHIFLSHWVETFVVGVIFARVESFIKRGAIVSNIQTLLFGLIHEKIEEMS